MIQQSFRRLHFQRMLTNLKTTFLQSPNPGIIFWEWFYNMFNRVDESRLKLVGPDRSCAEWILKNGGLVRFEGHEELTENYLNLIPESDPRVRDHLLEIYIDRAGITNNGFEHMKDCKHLTQITLSSCPLVGDSAIALMHSYLDNVLKNLEITSCPLITDHGIKYISKFSNLRKLTLRDLTGVSDKEKCETLLKKSLNNTNCILDI